MHRLTRHPDTIGDLDHRDPAEDLQHRCMPLFHNTELHQHDNTP